MEPARGALSPSEGPRAAPLRFAPPAARGSSCWQRMVISSTNTHRASESSVVRTTPEMRLKFVEMHRAGMSARQIAHEFGVDRNTVRHWLLKAASHELRVASLDHTPQWTRAGWAVLPAPVRPPRSVGKDPCSVCGWIEFCEAASVSGIVVLPCEGLLSWEVYDEQQRELGGLAQTRSRVEARDEVDTC
ncbi:MAG TPA: helix-turn-helix domain-containing protein [Anaerolineae bacterium]|nr:helix-turn-helix domain-containing protein [Anaerolineae bacterium]